ncbi:hypothetical protein [Microbulbifer sp. VVAC002]|uniref:hypothetical protein n=1 Tax=Microbulbifer sp. VVAC002 TaxID=3243387 RepID=UPI00403901A8
MEKIRVKVTKSFTSPVYGEVKEGEQEFSRAFAQQLIDLNAAEEVVPKDDEIDFDMDELDTEQPNQDSLPQFLEDPAPENSQ